MVGLGTGLGAGGGVSDEHAASRNGTVLISTREAEDERLRMVNLENGVVGTNSLTELFFLFQYQDFLIGSGSVTVFHRIIVTMPGFQMSPSRSPEQQAFDDTLESSKDVLEDLAQEALDDVAAGLADPDRDDAW